MNRKKPKRAILITVSLIFLIGVACFIVLRYAPMNMDTVVKGPHFAGTVIEVHENSILVSVAEGEEVRRSSDLIEVSLDVELADSITEFLAGDKVVVYYDENLLESYPARTRKVYAILLTSPDRRTLS